MQNSNWTIGSILDWTTGYLENAGIDTARLDAELMLASVLDCKRLSLALKRDEKVPPPKLDVFKEYLKKRKRREPLSYILGYSEFMGKHFLVSQDTLIPRPETELLVEEAIRLLKERSHAVVADVGTGSGNIAVTIGGLEQVDTVYAIDKSLEALSICWENIAFHALTSKVIPKHGDLLEPLQSEPGARYLDMIVSNPPYIAHHEFRSLAPELSFEPRMALDGGTDGLDFYKRIAEKGKTYLKMNGYVIVELNANKSREILQIFAGHAYGIKRVIKDYAGFERVVVAENI